MSNASVTDNSSQQRGCYTSHTSYAAHERHLPSVGAAHRVFEWTLVQSFKLRLHLDGLGASRVPHLFTHLWTSSPL